MAKIRSAGWRAIPGILGESAMQADTIMRRAANSVTFDGADTLEASVAATAGGLPGLGGWNERFRAALQVQDARDAYDLRNRTVAVIPGEILGGVLGFVGGKGPIGNKAVEIVTRWGNTPKGNLGETLSVLKTVSKLDVPVSFQKPLKVPGGVSYTDHQTLRGHTVEAKYRTSGKRAKLSKRQEEAKAMLGDKYREDNWAPKDVRNMTGAIGAGAVVGGRASDERRR